MRSLWAAGFLLRRLRAEAGVVTLLLTLVAATSFLFAAAPRLFNLVADAGLVDELRAAPTVERNFELSASALPPGGADRLSAVDDVGGAYLEGFPDSIRGLIANRHYVVTTPRFAIDEGFRDVSGRARYDTYVALRYQDGVEVATRIVEGRLPTATGDKLPWAVVTFDTPPPGLGPAPVPARVEIALSEAAARDVGASVGDSLDGLLDISDPILLGVLARSFRVQFEVVGIFSVSNPAAEVWYADRSLQRVDIGGSEEFPVDYATALMAPDAYADLTTSGLPFSFAWHYFLAPERVDVGQLDGLLRDLQRMLSQSANATFGPGIAGSLSLRAGLPRIVGRYQAERAASEAVLSVAAMGPYALAVGAIGMVAILLVMRRRTNFELTRSRGASSLLLLAAQLWEAALLAGAAALIGLLLAVLFVPGRQSSLSPLLAVASGAAAAAVLVAATWPMARRRLGPPGRDDPAVLPRSPRRLAIEVTGVGLALAGVLLLQQRGLVIGSRSGGGVVHADPFLAAVPVLAGLAMGVVALRLYPLPIRFLGWLAARRRDLVPVLGLRNVARHSAASNLPLLVLMLTAAFGSFTSVVMSSIGRGQEDAAWAQVGADYRIETATGDGLALIDPMKVRGAEAVAAAYVDPAATFSDMPSQRSLVVLLAVEPEAYAAVTAGSPIEPAWPTSFEAQASAGTPESPIPAIISQRPPSGNRSLGRGDTFRVTVEGQVMTFVVVDQRLSFPGVTTEGAFVVASLDSLQAAYLRPPLSPSVLFVRGSSDIEAPMTALVGDRSTSALVASRFERYATLQRAPLIAMVTGGFRIALAVAVLYAALAIVGALTLTATRRTQDLAFLRTLGLTQGQALGLTMLEHGPPVVLALLPGIGLGIALATLMGPGLGLTAFIGPDATFIISIAWGEIALIGVAMVMMVTIAGGAGTWLARRAQVVDALRLGGE